MHIANLKIKNYRNFSDFDIDLKPFTSIIGENNVGKTNFLNALGLIFSNEIIFISRRILEVDDINYNSVYNFKKTIVKEEIPIDEVSFPEVKVEVLMEEFDDDQQAVVADWFVDENFTKAKLTYVFNNRNPKKREWIKEQREKLKQLTQKEDESGENFLKRKISYLDFPIKDYSYSIFGGDDETKQAEWNFLRMLKMEYLDALRDAKRELIASGDSRLLYKILRNRDENKFSTLKDELSLLDQKIQKNSELKEISESIEELLDIISLQDHITDNSISFQFSSIEISEVLKKLSLVYGNEPITIERNGVGRNNLLYISLILSHLGTKQPDVDKVYFRLIGIEEPESHLHPHLQEHLGRNIEKKCTSKNQIIITSHSTHIASKLDLENTVVLYKNELGNIDNHYILSNFGKKAEDKKTIKYLNKYLDATNSTLFFSRKIILVEGISEKILIPIFFENEYGSTLGKERCEVVSVSGLAFKNFLDIVKNGYFIKCIALTDSDTGTDSENRAENLIQKYTDCKLILIKKTEETTFEKDIIKYNSNGLGKEILLKALEETKPISGKNYREAIGDSDISVEDFFSNIKKYKSEFAFNLCEILKEYPKDSFCVPTYIKEAFKFLMESS